MASPSDSPTPAPVPVPAPRPLLSARVQTALLGIPLVLLLIWVGGGPFRLFCLVLALGAMRELQVAVGRSDRLGGAQIIGAVAYPATFWALWHGLTPAFPWQVMGALFFVSVIFYGTGLRRPLISMGVTLLATLYVGLFALLPTLREGGHGELLYLTLFAVWASDTAAYYGGHAFGRVPLSKLSPGKTREGTFIGIVAAILVGATVAVWAQFPPLQGLAMGVVIAIAAPIGDLAESLWKRELGVKDMGTLFPGHGGILDRCDSILFAAFALLLYISTIAVTYIPV